MKAKHHQKDDQRKVEEKQSNDNIRKAIMRSFFEWSDGMRVIRQGKGEVAMTEGELAKFFGVSWQKVNHNVRLIKQTMCLKYYEIKAANAISSVSKQGDNVESYAPLCPLPIWAFKNTCAAYYGIHCLQLIPNIWDYCVKFYHII